VDLTTVLQHELGHVLGLTHDDTASFSIMAATLDTASLSAAADMKSEQAGSVAAESSATQTASPYAMEDVSPIVTTVELSPSATTLVPAASASPLSIAANPMVDNTNSAPLGVSASIPVPLTPLVWLALAVAASMFALRPSRTGLRNRSVSTT
jgi:hypothetical protein